MEEVKVQVRFKITEGSLEYTDSLYFDLDEYNSLDKQTIEDIKQARLDQHKQNLEAHANLPKPTKAEQLAEIAELEASIQKEQAYLAEKKAELQKPDPVKEGK